MGKQPILSLIVGGRNDTYFGDFLWRFTTSLNYLARSAASIGRQDAIEVVVCDWNSEVPLHSVMRLVPEAGEMVRFIVVPPEIAVPAQGSAEFPIPIVQNVAIRRARGEFVGQTDSDVLYTPATLLALLNVLEGKIAKVPVKRAFLAGARRHIPFGQVLRRPSLSDLEEYLNLNASLFPWDTPHHGTAAPTSLAMLHRDLWHECQGYDEQWVHWGWMDIDLALRVTQRYPLVHLNAFGVNLIHMEHYRTRSFDPTMTYRTRNRPYDTPQYLANDEHWGLNRETFAEHLPQCAVDDEESPPAKGAVACWQTTPETLSAEMSSELVKQIVGRVLEGHPVRPDPGELDAYRALAWYAANHHPRVYVETGMRHVHAACVAGIAAPGVEIYGVTAWERPGADEHLFTVSEDACLTFYNHACLQLLGEHWAYSRFIGGDPATAIERLADSYIGRFGVDLALVRAAVHGPQHAFELAARLSPGGAIVLLHPDAWAFQEIWSELGRRFPQHAFLRFSDHRTGIMLAATLNG